MQTKVAHSRSASAAKTQEKSDDTRKTTKLERTVYLRPYAARDIDRMVDIIAGVIPQLPNYAMITPDKGRIRYVLEHNIDNAAAFACWVVCDTHDIPQGGGAGWCVMSIMSKDLMADDIFMWVEPEYRSYMAVSLLVTAYADWAKARGAKIIRASHTGGSFKKGSREQELYDKLLTRLGFREVGSVYHYYAEGD